MPCRVDNAGDRMRFSNYLLPLILVFTQLTSSGCTNNSDQNQKEREQGQQDARAAKIAVFARTHSADYSWRSQLESSDRLQLTAELQKALIRPDGSPIVIDAMIDDILVLDDGGYEVHAHTLVGVGPSVYVRFRCTDLQASTLMSAGPFTEFAFAAKVDRLWRPFLQAKSQRDDDESTGSFIAVEPSVLVVAVGSMIAAVSLDE